MATKKKSVLDNMMENSHKQTQSVFNGSLFDVDLGRERSDKNNEDYKYDSVNVEDLIIENVEYERWLYNSLKDDRMVQPIILSYDFVEKEKAGRKYREKTGKYRIIDGKKRALIWKKLYEEANDEESKRKYETIHALILPLSIENEQLNKIISIVAEDKANAVTSVMRDVTETQNESITYCYRYEMQDIELDKIIERENKYTILQSEVDELEKSIFHLGLMQPIIVLPVLDTRSMSVRYEIQAGHKRTRAIRQLVEHAKKNYYPNHKDFILEQYKTVPALIIPMGTSAEDVEKVYNETNLLSRHMTSEDVFTHISYFEDLPSRPNNKEDYINFKNGGYTIKDLSKVVQERFKRLGFKDWKNSKTTYFLNVYYYGSDKALEMFTDLEHYNLTQKELYWIVLQNKDFNERKKQDEIIDKSLEDKSYLIELMNKNKVRRNSSKGIKIKKLSENLLKQKEFYEKMCNTEIEKDERSKNVEQDIEKIKEILLSTKKYMDELEKKISNI